MAQSLLRIGLFLDPLRSPTFWYRLSPSILTLRFAHLPAKKKSFVECESFPTTFPAPRNLSFYPMDLQLDSVTWPPMRKTNLWQRSARWALDIPVISVIVITGPIRSKLPLFIYKAIYRGYSYTDH